MNKQGTVVHWVIFFGVLVAFGSFCLALGTNPGVGLRGMWHIHFLWGLQESEKDLLLIDSLARTLVAETKDRMNNPAYTPVDFGCGFFDESLPAEGRVPLLNRGAKYCSPTVHEQFVAQFSALLQQRQNFFYEVTLIGPEVVAKSIEKKVLTSGEAQEPNEIALSHNFFLQQSGFSIQEVGLSKPFYFRYEYNPGFRVPIGTDFSEFFAARLQASAFVESCRAEADLSSCVQANLPSERWVPYANCWPCLQVNGRQPTESCFYPVAEKDRKVAFCYQGDGIRTSLALDFS